jgi:rubredoxin
MTLVSAPPGVVRDVGPVVAEGQCRVCHKAVLFEKGTEPWVIKTGLCWVHYDDVVTCPRCGKQHKRGWIGKKKNERCGKPYANQDEQTD